MYLSHLELTNFKNIPQAQLDFCPKVNCLLGDNGMGKSNLLDAIYCLSFTKSYTPVTDSMLITRGESFSLLNASYIRREVREDILMSWGAGKRKVLKRSGKEYKRLSTHIGLFPLVLVSPGDQELVRGTAQGRRRWLDMIISQIDSTYLHHLITYAQALEARNKLLHQRTFDPGVMEALDVQLAMAADPIVESRQAFVKHIMTAMQHTYALIAGSDEQITMDYQSELLQPGITMPDLLLRSSERDRFMGYTTAGPHRDDIVMTLNGLPMRHTGSEGQCKTFTIALRLAQYEVLHNHLNLRPMLLLDDIFDRLDRGRVERIMQLVAGENYGQIFITDTNRAHLDSIMARSPGDYAMFTVENGRFTHHTPDETR